MRKPYEQNMLECAIILARLYGVRETLNPLPYVKDEYLIPRVLAWADEYLRTGGGDIVAFFQKKN